MHAYNENVQCHLFPDFFSLVLLLCDRAAVMTFNADTYVKVDSFPLRDFGGSELCDQRPVKKMALLHPILEIRSVALYGVDQGRRSGDICSDGSGVLGVLVCAYLYTPLGRSSSTRHMRSSMAE